LNHKHLLTGIGWRIGWSPKSEPYQGLIGGEHWAVELSEAEIRNFCSLCLQLAQVMADMESELADRESLDCSSQIDDLTITFSGYPGQFGIYFCATCGRSLRKFEGSWAEVVPEFLAAIQEISNLINLGLVNADS
jgi:hypothetical protein